MMIKLPKLNGAFGEIEGNIDPNVKIVYVIRLTETVIPMPNSDLSANFTMPEHFCIGSISGMFLKSISDVLKEVYKKVTHISLI